MRLSLGTEAERRQLLLAARFFARTGADAVFVCERDQRAFAFDRLDLFLGSVEP